MRANRFLQPCVLLLLASSTMTSLGQPRPCSAVPTDEREAARASGACTDAAPTDQLSPKKAEPAPVVIPIPNVVGLTFDDARARLSGFLLRRAYRASAEPGGTVLEQQPAAPARGAVGSVVNVVVSDGTLRPAPRVAASEVDQPPAPAVAAQDVVTRSSVTPNVSAAASEPSRAGETRPSLTPPGAATGAAQQIRAPQVVGMPIAQAQARLREFRIERIDRPNNASIGKVIAQSPKALESIEPGQSITLIVSSGPADSAAAKAKNLAKREVVTRKASPGLAASSESAQVSPPIDSVPMTAPAESKIERVDVPGTAAQTEVLTQVPPPGNAVTTDTTTPPLPASDGSLVAAAATPPVVAPEPAPPATPAPSPVRAPPQAPIPITFSSNMALTLGAGIVLGVLIGVWLTRRWLLNRRPPIDVTAPGPGVASVDTAPGGLLVAGTPPGVRFDARLDEGKTTIEFAAPANVDADQDADEMTAEASGDVHV